MNFKVTNQRFISAHSERVYEAIDSELRNISFWSKPFLTFKSSDPNTPLCVNQFIWLYVGFLHLLKMEMRIISLVPAQTICVEYVSGDFVGFGEFKFDTKGSGTNVVFSWSARIHSRRLKVLTKLLPVKNIHFFIVNLVLKNLERYLIK